MYYIFKFVQGGIPSRSLQYAIVQIKEPAVCRTYFNPFLQGMLCAGNVSRDACSVRFRDNCKNRQNEFITVIGRRRWTTSLSRSASWYSFHGSWLWRPSKRIYKYSQLLYLDTNSARKFKQLRNDLEILSNSKYNSTYFACENCISK